MDWERIGLRIAAQRPLGELRDAYARADIIALDLDECIFPGFSQMALGTWVGWRALLRPERGRDRLRLPRMAFGGLLFAFKIAKRLVGVEPSAARLIAWYEWAMRGISEERFVESARRLPRRSYPFAAETVAMLASHAPTGLSTLGLDVVARAYAEQFRGEAGPSLSFYDANAAVFRQGPRGRSVFAGYDRERLLLTGDDKRGALERRMAALGAAVPMVVGHSADDVPLALFARERGGLAVGFNPSHRLAKAFDVVVTGRDWEGMYALVALLERRAPPS